METEEQNQNIEEQSVVSGIDGSNTDNPGGGMKVALVVLVVIIAGLATFALLFQQREDATVTPLTEEQAAERQDQVLDRREAIAEVLTITINESADSGGLGVKALVVDESRLGDVNFRENEGIELPTIWKEYELNFDQNTEIIDGEWSNLTAGAYVRITAAAPLLAEAVHQAISVKILQQ